MRLAVSSTRQTIVDLLAALNIVFGFPRPGASTYASIVANLAAKANPAAPAAQWAIRVDAAQPFGDDMTAPQISWLTAEQLFALDPADPHYVALPVGVAVQDINLNTDPLWATKWGV